MRSDRWVWPERSRLLPAAGDPGQDSSAAEAHLFSHPASRIAWRHPALAVVLGLSTLLNVIGLSQEGYANTYYAAAVRSMLMNWHNFFFVSFDPGGFVAVDKPPLGLWLQVASAKIFGFSGVSVLLPQAVAGILAVALLYRLVARVFGPGAGLLAALALAITPISVVDDRNNTSDSVLILVLLLAAWAVTQAIETRRLRWFVLSAVFIGLGFNIKGFESYLVLPALFLAYVLGVPQRWFTRLWHVLLAGVTTLVVSFAWIITVDLTPASQRPYVSDSGTNSELSLALGYNGLGRLATGLVSRLSSIPFLHVSIDFTIVPGISTEIGNPSLLRLLEPQIGGQASWLLPVAIVGLFLALFRIRPVFPLQREHVALGLWGGWLVVAGAFFTVARFYHLYYLNLLAPAVSALAGIGIMALWNDYRESLAIGKPPWWKGWLLPLSILTTAFIQAHLLSGYTAWNSWLAPTVVGVSVVVAALLAAGRLGIRVSLAPGQILGINRRAALVFAAAGTVALVSTPVVFAADSVASGNGGAWLPQAGPTVGFGGGGFRGGGRFAGRPGGFGSSAVPGSSPSFGSGGGQPPSGGFAGGKGGFGFRGGGFGGGGALTFAGDQVPVLGTKLLRYLETHRGAARYLVATPTSSYASLFILDTGQPVMALGGYQGWDKILTRPQLAQMVKSGVVRFFLLSGSAGGFGGRFGSGGFPGGVDANLNAVNDGLFSWVESNCSAVPASRYETTSNRERNDVRRLWFRRSRPAIAGTWSVVRLCRDGQGWIAAPGTQALLDRVTSSCRVEIVQGVGILAQSAGTVHCFVGGLQ